MKIPPLVIHDDENALLSILKSIATKEEAIATFASAEARRLHILSGLLEKTGYSLTKSTSAEIKESALSSLQVTQAMQERLKSSLEFLLAHNELTSLYDLVPMPKNCSCCISAFGSGFVSKENDLFFKGRAKLHPTKIVVDRGKYKEVAIRYAANCNNLLISFEAVADGLDIYFLDPKFNSPLPKNPEICLIVGCGVVKYTEGDYSINSLGTFALTLWDLNKKRNQDKFRMVIYGISSKMAHDTGIVI